MSMQLGPGGPGGPGDNQRNFILFIIIAGAILLGWEFLYAGPQQRQLEAQRARIEAQNPTHQTPGAPGAAGTNAPAAPQTREQALAATANARAQVTSAALDGSIQLRGARFDDLNLRGYRQTIDRNSPEVTLLAPNGAVHGYDAFFGWEDQTRAHSIGDDAVWTAPAGATLTPQTPLVLTYSGDGLQVTRTITMDENYMFSAHDVVRNAGAAPVTLRPFGVVRRQGLPADYVNRGVVEQGFAGAFGPNTTLHVTSYQKAETHARDRDQGKVGESQVIAEEQGPGGWLGVSDHYWLTALVLDRSEQISASFDSRHINGVTDFRAVYRGQWRTLQPGQSIEYNQRLFAGAKRLDLLQDYQHDHTTPGQRADGPHTIPRFDEAVDWGNLMWPLTRPFFAMLDYLANKIGAKLSPTFAFGIGILLTTIVIRLLFFPIMYNTSKSMAKMRVIAPKMKEIQERYASDPQRQQQEMIKLYQTEKINPITGCLPMLLQIPVFFALYKTLSVTIEMRHAPFFGWIRDLSAPDPTSIFNLFGLLPYDPHAIPVIGAYLGLGVWPILYGLSMTAQQALSPPPADATQAQIFRLMPIVFTLMLAGLPSGLLIYYTWSYTLLILQQYVILRRQGVETPFDQFIAKRMKPKAVTPAE